MDGLAEVTLPDDEDTEPRPINVHCQESDGDGDEHSARDSD
jgi:hypothetical protein